MQIVMLSYKILTPSLSFKKLYRLQFVLLKLVKVG